MTNGVWEIINGKRVAGISSRANTPNKKQSAPVDSKPKAEKRD